MIRWSDLRVVLIWSVGLIHTFPTGRSVVVVVVPPVLAIGVIAVSEGVVMVIGGVSSLAVAIPLTVGERSTPETPGVWTTGSAVDADWEVVFVSPVVFGSILFQQIGI